MQHRKKQPAADLPRERNPPSPLTDTVGSNPTLSAEFSGVVHFDQLA
ncbi:hypothetical protein [Synechococcus sp. MIT S1220]